MRLSSSVPSDGRLATCYEAPSFRNFHPTAELRRLSRFLDLFRTLSVHRVKVRYKQSYLGLVWATFVFDGRPRLRSVTASRPPGPDATRALGRLLAQPVAA